MTVLICPKCEEKVFGYMVTKDVHAHFNSMELKAQAELVK